MKATMMSMNGNNKAEFGNCNNSIIMLRSESNSDPNDISSPLSTQTMLLM